MTVSAKLQLAQMARYHAWATERLLASLEQIADEAYHKPCGLFFGSVHRTLNHLLLTDSGIWYPRFVQAPIKFVSLDAEVETDRAELASSLETATARWSAYIDGLDDAAIAGDLCYMMTTGQPRVLPMSVALFHVFNHGTHHRGQVTAAVSMLGFEYEPLDLPLMVFSESR